MKIICTESRKEVSLQKEMTDDLIALVTSFSWRIHGSRSWKNKKRSQKKSCNA